MLHSTRIDLPKKTREKLIDLLADRLADGQDLFYQLKQAHWNVRGAHFLSYHELFDKIAEDVEDYADDLAERIGQLGGTSDGTVQRVAKASSLKAYPVKIVSGKDHIGAVAAALADFGAKVRSAIDVSGKLGDAGTADLFTEISRGVDQWLWFVEAHEQA